MKLCELFDQTICAVITDGAEIGTAAKIGNDDTLWIWCTVHLLSLVFQDSFVPFPQDAVEKKAFCLVMLRKTVNFFIQNFDKLSLHMPIPKGCCKVSIIKILIIFLEKKVQEAL